MAKVLQIMSEPKARHALTNQIKSYALPGSIALTLAVMLGAFFIKP